MSKLKLYRELINLRDDFDSAVNGIIDPFLEKNIKGVTMSIASNMSGDSIPRGELVKQMSCAKQKLGVKN